MSQPPTLDDRSQEELLAEFTERADQYVDGWESSSEDMASVLLRVGSEFGTDLIGQLNRLPTKQRAAFLDTLGAESQPPQAARLPLSVSVSTNLDRNVPVPGGTQVVAESSDGETEPFEIPQGRGFEATPASLTESYAVDPTTDRLLSHEPLTDGDSQQLFAGENRQQHAIYLGDSSLLRVDPGSVIEIEFQGSVDASALDKGCVWEYYGGDDEGTEGWHSVPAGDAGSGIGTDDGLSYPVDQQSTPTPSTDEEHSVRLQLPAELVETTVGGIESRWIRCRLDEPASACFTTEIESVRATVGQSTETDRLTPDAAFANDVPLDLDGDGEIRPFGRQPQPSSTLYLAASEALTKLGGLVTLTFEPSTDTASESASTTDGSDDASTGTQSPTDVDFGALSGPPEVSWEYWNGTGWAGLAVRSDDTNNLQAAGDVQFTVPDDIAETAVSGHEARWIRGRLVGGSYGQPAVGLPDHDTDTAQLPASPQYGSISLQYEHTDSPFAHVVTENNGMCEPVAEAGGYRPFKRLPDAHQTLYLGFDATLRNGPIPLFAALAETTHPQGFDPGVQWEYCTDPETDSWSRLPVDDGTSGVTERGIVSLQLPESTTSHERFGTHCHWLRAVVTEDSFVADEGTNSQPTQPAVDSPAEPTAQPPVVEGLYLNTQWADNARTVEDETLGTSDGSANQAFTCAHGPLLDCEVWVDEADSLSTAERADLRKTTDRVEIVTDDHGNIESFWVRWTPVAEFVGVGGENRIYRCDRSAGTIRFGDGNSGRIPPRGNPVRVTYTTGGGEGGNVEAGAVTHLKTPISLVESVDNPFPADGGAGGESMDAVASRVAGEIRTRGKAVTAADFEQVAATAVRKLAAVECKPQLGSDGDRSPGITLLIVPDTDHERPRPSTELEGRVQHAVSEAAPARLTDGERSQITVRGPSYTPVSVDATVQSTGVTSISGLKTEIESTLAAHLHPITGGSEGTGWEFGEPPTADSLASLLNSVPGVDTVTELSTTVQIGDDTVQLRRGLSSMQLPVDGLVCTGSHEISVQVGDER